MRKVWLKTVRFNNEDFVDRIQYATLLSSSKLMVSKMGDTKFPNNDLYVCDINKK